MFLKRMCSNPATLGMHGLYFVPAGVPSALADILGAELGPIIDFVKAKGGGLCDKINS